jgi:aspartate-semialdehyde dehydrogenase
MWGKDALLAHVAKAPGLMTPSAAYTFEWDIENMNLPVVIGRIREDNRDRDLLKAKYAFDNKVVGADLGYFFSTVMD